MILAIDIDDTMTYSFEYFQRYVAEFFHKDIEYLKKNNISYNNFPREWQDEATEDFGHAVYEKAVPDTPFKDGAVYYINKLHAEGHKIIAITARDFTEYKDPVATTKLELENNNIKYDEIVCVINKAKACQERKVDLFIDDTPYNLYAVESAGISVIMFNGPAYKDETVPFKRVDNWAELYNLIQQMTK